MLTEFRESVMVSAGLAAYMHQPVSQSLLCCTHRPLLYKQVQKKCIIHNKCIK